MTAPMAAIAPACTSVCSPLLASAASRPGPSRGLASAQRRPGHGSARLAPPSPSSTVASKPLVARRRTPPPPQPAVRRSGMIVRASAAGDPDVVIVGGGLSGLACARTLTRAGRSVLLLEAAPEVGGRVRTDKVDGFLLDRGFQIWLSSFPECEKVLDYDALDLQDFYAGALVRADGEFHRVADPLRHPLDGIASLTNPIGTVADKVRVGWVRLSSLLGSVDDLLKKEETTIEARLRATGFTEVMIDRFFRPFLGGIFFDRQLRTTSRLFDFVMRMLATGSNCLPAGGMGAVSEQLASQLPAGSIRTGAKVEAVEGGSVTLAGGEVVEAKGGVVVSVEGPEAARLLGDKLSGAPSKPAPGVGTCCVYFSTDEPPKAGEENVLFLDGEGKGLVNNMCFPSSVAPSYAPPGKTLVSVSTIGTCPDLSDEQLASAVQEELSSWFPGEGVESWSLLRVYRIPFAQPNQEPPTNLQREVDLGGGLYVCGDHRDAATHDAALISGRRAAEAILAK